MRKKQKFPRTLLLAFLTVAGLGGPAHAAGIQIFEQSPSGQGNAFAGAAAVAEDASTIFFNPAGMAFLDGSQVVGGLHIIIPRARFENGGSLNPVGAPQPGTQSIDGGALAVVPNFYVAHALTDRLWLGFGANSPFGLVTDYDTQWVGRYQADRSELTTINLNPSIAYRVTDWLSLAAGFDLVYADALLSNAVDFGALLGAPGTLDGNSEVLGDDWAPSWNVGVMLQPFEGTRIGLAYRHKSVLHLRGNADFLVPAGAAAVLAGGAFIDTGVRAKITMPETATLAVYQQVTPELEVFADVTWTRWTRFQQLVVVFDNPLQPASVLQLNWNNTFRVAGGLNYKVGDRSKLRFGFAYDPSPVTDFNRGPRIPDDDRYWFSVGYSLEVLDGLSLDVAFTHILVPGDVDINFAPGGVAGTVRGKYDANVNIFTAGVKWVY